MKASTGDKNPFFGKTHTEDTKKIMSEKKLGRGEWNKGLVRSDENKLKISITLKSRNQRPWESPMVYTRPDNLLKWALADYYYELYLTNTSLTSAKFTTLYNRTHNDTLPAIAFKAMHSEFVRGWNPSQDSEWLSFKEEYERT